MRIPLSLTLVMSVAALTAFSSVAAAQSAPPPGTVNPASADAIKQGRTQWLRYDTRANQTLGCDIAPTIDSAMFYKPDPMLPGMYGAVEVGLKRLHSQIIACQRPADNVGADEYQRAESFFRQAYSAPQPDPRAFRQLAMLLADKRRWTDLQSVAREQTRRDPSDPWGWFALALAMHRAGNAAPSSAMFDSAVVRFSPAEASRLFAFERLLQRRDSSALARAPRDVRSARERAYWAAADPLWSRQGADPRTEFLARVAYAELRWTVEEEQVRGADSDRGEAYIRYGPPDRIIALRGSEMLGTNSVTEQQGSSQRDANQARLMNLPKDRAQTDMLLPRPSDVVTWWDYDNGLSLVFWGAPSYGTARFPASDATHFEHVVETRAAAFDNVSTERIIPLGMQTARFRGTADSLDALVIVLAPVGAIRGGVSGSAPVRGDFWLVDSQENVRERDSVSLQPSGLDQKVFRVAPGTYSVRIEATADGSMIAGRALGTLRAASDSAGLSLRGFAMSDPLMAVVARPNVTPAERWFDFDVAPLIGPLPRARNLELLWEVYELAASGGTAQYTVRVTLEKQRSGPGRIAASIVGVAASALGIDRRDDRVTLTFERTVPAREVVVDQISLALGDTPPGDYRFTLAITDKTSGRTVTRSAPLVVTQ